MKRSGMFAISFAVYLSFSFLRYCNLVVDNSGSVDRLPILAEEISQYMTTVTSYNRLVVLLAVGIFGAFFVKRVFYSGAG
jgi:hypothetical protein